MAKILPSLSPAAELNQELNSGPLLQPALLWRDLLEHQKRADVCHVNIRDRVPKEFRRRAERRIG